MLVVMTLLGGLALFLYGMKTMGDGLEKFAGDRMRKFLEVVAGTPVKGVLIGAAVTAIIQSSSATTVMVVGFVNAGLLTLRQAIGVIMGANIGTTITAQLIAFKLSDYIMPIIFIGFAFYFFSKQKKYIYIGQFILGFGILFLGLDIMSDAMAPLRTHQGVREFIAAFATVPVFGVVIGMLMTMLIQSSSATIGILIALASQGLVPLDAAIPVLFGDNIGTCITALIASLGTKLSARRAAVAHITFNVCGTIIFLLLLPLFKELVLLVSPDGDVARQIANAHTAFNTLNTLLFLPLVGVLEKLVINLVPGEEEIVRFGPVYLDDRVLKSPSIALSLATKEIIRMANFCRDNLKYAMQAFFEKDESLVKQVLEYEDLIDGLEKDVAFYLAKAAQHSMTPELSDKHAGLLNALNDFERVGDHAENIANLANRRIEGNLPFSDRAIEELGVMQEYVLETFEKAIYALEHEDREQSREIVQRESRIDCMEKQLRNSHINRINAGLCYPASGVVFLDIISNLERIGDHSHNIANLVLGTLPGVEEDIIEEIRNSKQEG